MGSQPKTGFGGDKIAHRSQAMGFTLVELLVLIVIIGIVAAVLFSATLSNARKAGQAGCRSNLKQVSLGVQMFAGDNGDWLPPGAGASFGLLTPQRADYSSASDVYKCQLAYYIATYLGQPAPDSQLRVIKSMFCPAFAHSTGDITNIAGKVSYALPLGSLLGLTNANGAVWNPFGYPPGQLRPAAATHKITEVQSIPGGSNIWMLVDADRASFPYTNCTWYSQLADKPVHGDVRNYVFFDGHVATQKIGAAGADQAALENPGAAGDVASVRSHLGKQPFTH